MKIEKTHLEHFKNEEYFQYLSEFNYLVNQYNPTTLGIEKEFALYMVQFGFVNEAIEPIRKSLHSDELSQKDKERDQVFRGLSDSVKAALNHFNLEIQDAAEKLWLIFKHYGNLATLPYNEETASVVNFISELRTSYSAELNTTGLTSWVDTLEQKNNAFDALMKERFSSDAQKTNLKMRDIRTQTDIKYRLIIEKLNALIIVNGEAQYLEFVKELNERIEKYEKIMSIRKGKKQKVEMD